MLAQLDRQRWYVLSSPALVIGIAHLMMVVTFFHRLLLLGDVPYFRDLASFYYPCFALIERAAAEGVAWPLWNRYSNAGEPFLEPYIVNLLSVRLFGALGALRLDAPLHVLLAACGASALAHRRGAAPSGAWAAGVFYGLGGFVLSCANSLQLFHGVCWAPVILAALVGCLTSVSGRRVAVLAVAVAMQISTMAADVVLLTALAALVLWPRRPRWTDLPPLVAAAGLALILAAPAFLGTRWLLEETRRGRGFSADEILDFSARVPVLMEAVLPRFLGDVHTFSDVGYWGQSFFGDGYPYLVSLYLGPCVLLLAALGLREKGWRPCAALIVLGVLLALGRHGPFAPVLTVVLRYFRYPVKYFFLAHLGVCLLAARGVDAAQRRPPGWARYAPAALLLAAAAAIGQDPRLPARVFGEWLPALTDWRALVVSERTWPFELFRTGALAAAVGLALAVPRRGAALAAGFAALDLALVNARCHPTTNGAFYRLLPDVRAAFDEAARRGPDRWFAFGASNSPGTRWNPVLAASNSDAWLYYADRQTLWGSAHILDGVETAFQEEHSFAPDHATLTIEQRRPEGLREFVDRLRLANVRWIASLVELPEDLVAPAKVVPLPFLVQALRVYELRGTVPRVFWVGRSQVAVAAEYWNRAQRMDFDPMRAVLLERPLLEASPSVAPGEAVVSVKWDRPDPHTIHIEAATPPGFIVVAEGYRRDWQATDESGRRLPVVRANGRYMAVVVASAGEHVLTLRLRPRWRPWALGSASLGILAALSLARGRPRQEKVVDEPGAAHVHGEQ